MPRSKKAQDESTMELEGEEGPSTGEVDEKLQQLAQLGAELSQVATNAHKATAKLAEIEEFLGNLRIKDYADLAESPVVQKFIEMLGMEGLSRPGETAKRGTLAERTRDWTWEDCRRMKQVRFEPRETLALTWNGLTVQVIDGQEITVPEPFYDLYREHRFRLEQAAIHERYLLGHSDRLPASGYLTDESALVRAWSTMTGPDGKPSAGTLGVGPLAGVAMPSDEPSTPVAVTPEGKSA